MALSSKKKLDIIHKFVGILASVFVVVIMMSFIYSDKPYVEYISDQSDITCVNNGTCHIIKCTIKTAGKVVQPVLTLETHKFGIEVYLNSELIYSNNTDLSAFSYGLDTVELPANYAGSSLQIRYYQKEPSASFTLPTIRIMSALDYSTDFIKKIYVKLSVSLAIFACGICFALCLILNKVDKLLEPSIRITSLFLIFSSIWTLTGTGALRVLSVSDKVMYYIEYLSMYASILIIIILLKEHFKPSGIYKIIYYALFSIISIYIATSVILQIFDVTTFYSTLKIFQGIAILYGMFFLLIAYKKNILRTQVTSKTLIVMIIVVCLIAVGLIEIVKSASRAYYFSDSTLPYIILGYAIYSIAHFINYAMTGYATNYEVDTLRTMAYTDLMSGVGNRNSCERHFSKIMKNETDCFNIVMFDINGLKTVNDTLGHKQGDKLITEFAKLLSNEFDTPECFIGRMGGDEFVLIYSDEKQKLLDKLALFDVAIENVNASSLYSFDISYSYGMSCCNRANGDDIWVKYSESDKKMYRNKRVNESGV